MDYELELKNEQLENMIHVYREHIDVLEKENKQLKAQVDFLKEQFCLLYTSPSPRDRQKSRMPSSA